MPYFFLDNFRGFTSTLLPLSNVNFFVGENSTGKTSLLTLIYTLSTSQFWYNSNFPFTTSDSPIASTFEDIVSVTSNDKTYFSVGWLAYPVSPKNNNLDPLAYLITYTQKDGMPTISAVSYLTQKTQLHVRLNSSSISYKTEPAIGIKDANYDDLKRIFINLQQMHRGKDIKREFHVLPREYVTLSNSLSILLSLIISYDQGVREKKDKFDAEAYLTNVNSIISQAPFQNPVWLAPIRTKPKTTYDEYSLEYSGEGKHTPYLIRKYFQAKKDRERFLSFIEKFGENSNLFETISIKKYGPKITSPFELNIKLTNSALKITNVGYGISQILPVIVEIFSRSASTCFFIQQPEVHLHPKAQVALGTLLYELSSLEKKIFLVETHSDFIIDGFRIANKENKIEQTNSQIIFFERCEKGNQLCPIPILQNGDLPESQPTGYRDFFMNHEMKILGY